MPDKANDLLPEAPELCEAADAIARGRERELVKQAQRLREAADQQIEGVQATIEQAECVLDRSQQLLGDKSASRAPSTPGPTSDQKASHGPCSGVPRSCACMPSFKAACSSVLAWTTLPPISDRCSTAAQALQRKTQQQP